MPINFRIACVLPLMLTVVSCPRPGQVAHDVLGIEAACRTSSVPLQPGTVWTYSPANGSPGMELRVERGDHPETISVVARAKSSGADRIMHLEFECIKAGWVVVDREANESHADLELRKSIPLPATFPGDRIPTWDELANGGPPAPVTSVFRDVTVTTTSTITQTAPGVVTLHRHFEYASDARHDCDGRKSDDLDLDLSRGVGVQQARSSLGSLSLTTTRHAAAQEPQQARPARCAGQDRAALADGRSECPWYTLLSKEGHWRKVRENLLVDVQGTVASAPEISDTDFCSGHFDADFEFNIKVAKTKFNYGSRPTPQDSLVDDGLPHSVLAPENLEEGEFGGTLPLEVERMEMWPDLIQSDLQSKREVNGRLEVPSPHPSKDAQVAARGTLIWDCGHPGTCGVHSELHPVVALTWLDWPQGALRGQIHIRLLGWEPAPSLRRQEFGAPFEVSFKLPQSRAGRHLRVAPPRPVFGLSGYRTRGLQGCRGHGIFSPDVGHPLGYIDAAKAMTEEPGQLFKVTTSAQADGGELLLRVESLPRVHTLHEQGTNPAFASFVIELDLEGGAQ